MVFESTCRSSLVHKVRHRDVEIDPYDGTSRTYDIRHEETHVTHPAADIENAHASSDPGRVQRPLG